MATKKVAKKRVLSAAGRKAIAEAQKRRWADAERQNEAVYAHAATAVHFDGLHPANKAVQSALPKEPSTCSLVGEVGCQAYRLRIRLTALLDQVSDGKPPQPGDGGISPVPPGFNVRLHASVADLSDTDEIVSKIAAYLGVEV